MKRRFTNAAQRAIEEACRHTAGGSEAMGAPALLLGLLAEAECRAALVLARHGVNAEAVRVRWPELLATRARGGPPPAGTQCDFSGTSAEQSRRLVWSFEVEQSLAAAESRLRDHWIDWTELGTEHLLLGLAAADHEVGTWLRRQGLDPRELEAEICRRAGAASQAAVPLDVEPPGMTGQVDRTTSPQPAENASVPSCRGALHSSGQAEGDAGQCPSRPTTEAQDPAPAPPGTTEPETSLLRVLDAAANRCREGLRVLEDYVRFVLDDRHLTRQLKQLRHDLAAALDSLPRQARLAARNTAADVGTVLTTLQESRRKDAAGVVAANLARVTESLRSLEEFGKLFCAETAASFKQLRYRCYTLEKALGTTLASVVSLAEVRLCLVVDGRGSAEQFAQLVAAVVEAGADMVQLRDKRLDDRQLLARARLARQLTRGTSTKFIVNDRADLALVAQADGVHVGQTDLDVQQVRHVVGAGRLVGVSTHSIEQARQAVLSGADYLGAGPVFPSSTKQFSEFPGLELLAAIAGEIRLPTFAIGGITLENLPQVLRTGIGRVAVSGAVLRAEEPAAVVRAFRATLLASH